MSNNFITNNKANNLKDRLIEIIGKSTELRFLVGFFYFSGIKELYEVLKEKEDTQVKVLVGLQVDKLLSGAVEHGQNQTGLTNKEIAEQFLDSVKKSINTTELDTEEFYNQVSFFLKLIQDDRLIIRKTLEPNHAKLYIFSLEDGQITKDVFITGSSNLTKAGLHGQHELNVEISDYGTVEANEYFENLWDQAVEITEKDETKERLINVIENETLVADITPFEAFALVLKTFLDVQKQKDPSNSTLDLLESQGYTKYKYQIDAVKQGLAIIEEHNGVIVSDVVGLGKSVIASMIARDLDERGVIISPPNLMGDKNARSGWKMYKEHFKLRGWQVRSSGKLEEIQDLIKENDEYGVVIIDEAHRFRNQDTESYEQLSNICRGKKVILLTATPFNNSPDDIFSLLKLFIVPGKSNITLTDDLEGKFRYYSNLFDKLSYIKKNYNSANKEKRQQAENYYKKIFDEIKIDIKNVEKSANGLSRSIRSVIEPVMIRRNRIDLRRDKDYAKEIRNLSDVQDPEELFFDLTKEQSTFYDKVLQEYFGDGGRFKGAIYQPFVYEKGDKKEKELSLEENRERLAQKNLFDFMRRLLVKRFESSFGAFRQSIKNFKRVTKVVLDFIEKTDGEYILDRDLIEKIYQKDEDEIEEELRSYEEEIKKGDFPKNHKRYNVNDFVQDKLFLKDIKADIALYDEILQEMDELNIVGTEDPKIERLKEAIDSDIPGKSKKGEPKRKLIVFSEYADTVKYLTKQLKGEYKDRFISVTGSISAAKSKEILENFDAKSKKKKDEYDIILTTDKLAEGFNLNRAGAVINYDIPWNPTRVIQRVGRINRIGTKVFDNLYIFNFFPTEKGLNVVRSKQIAQQKMFLIHNTLGEDAKIFDADETPSAAKLFAKVQQNPEEGEEESIYTKIKLRFQEIEKSNPETIERIAKLPPRVKVAKKAGESGLYVFIRKGFGFFTRGIEGEDVEELQLQDVLEKIEAEPRAEAIQLSDTFWDNYEDIKSYKETFRSGGSEHKLDVRAKNNLKTLRAFFSGDDVDVPQDTAPFIDNLLEDLNEYKTLGTFTHRRIAALEAEEITKENYKETYAELQKIKNDIGVDFLEKVKKSAGSFKDEVIIAIENQS